LANETSFENAEIPNTANITFGAIEN